MPAIITHHMFGEDAAAALPQDVIGTQEELLALLLGSQGPDPLFFRFRDLPSRGATIRALGTTMHSSNPAYLLFSMREAVSRLPLEDQGVGRAFVLGQLTHFLLDSRCHPYIYAETARLGNAAGIPEGQQGDVHILLESEIDVWMLWSKRQLTLEEAPASACLQRTDRVGRVCGAIIAAAASEIFNVTLRTDDYAACLADYEFVIKAVDPYGSTSSRAVGAIERGLRGHSQLLALAHRQTTSDECAAANLECHEWTNPWTGAVSNESFGDLYYAALDEWIALSESLTRGNIEEFALLAKGIDYNGRPLAS